IKNFDPKKDDLEDISINKINHLRDAVCANIVGVIIKLQEKDYFPGYIIFESLKISTSNSDLEKQNTFLGNLINEKIYNKLQLFNEVPPILKQFRNDIDEKNIIQHGKVVYVNKDFTSSACPVCNETLTKLENGKVVDKKDNEIFKLGGHMTDFENEMKHLTDEEYKEWLKNDSFRKINTEKGKVKNNKYYSLIINGKICDFYLQNPKYPEFLFLTSGDDLATYNIAKKGIEYIKSNP
ncbi:MAG: hypothetical protein PHO80_05600, partial [Candidatus Gracilibacteria bacterium]|nr:hypothetical protein [Candidatus Gracilibacteria bacterium]